MLDKFWNVVQKIAVVDLKLEQLTNNVKTETHDRVAAEDKIINRINDLDRRLNRIEAKFEVYDSLIQGQSTRRLEKD